MELSDSSKQALEIMKPSETSAASEEAAEGLQATNIENELQVISGASCSPAPLAAAGVVRALGDPKVAPAASSDTAEQESGRERLKRHREEMAGRVWIPEKWGQEGLLKDWIDSSVFDEPLVPKGLRTAREALVEECRRRTSSWPPLQIDC